LAFGHTTAEGRTHIIVGRVHKQIHACEDMPSSCRSEQTPWLHPPFCYIPLPYHRIWRIAVW